MSRSFSWSWLWVDPGATRVVLALAFGLHYALGAAVGFSVDEAHYALYASHLALSYFDHPPLVGWVQWPLVALDAPVSAMRWIPEMLWLGTALAVFQTAERLHALANPARQSDPVVVQIPRLGAGFWSVLVLALAPLLHVLGIGLLPDTLLMFFTAVLVWQTLGLLEPKALTNPWRWLALGLVLGLAGLGKYTAIFAAVAAVVCLTVAHGLRWLRSPWPWVAALVALALVSPVLIWNYQNQWISFVYQTQHGSGGGWKVAHLAQFLVVQGVVYGPLLLWGAVGWRRLPTPALRSLVAFFLVPFVVLAALSGGGTSLPHWTAPAWVALAPLAGLGLAHFVRATNRAWSRRVVGALAGVQLVLSLGLMGFMASGGAPWLKVERGNPFADLHGWDAAGEQVRRLAQAHQLSSVSVQNWTLASRLGWYARPLPVHVLEDRFDQFDFWAGDLPQGGSTLLVDWSQMPYELPLAPHGFAQCTLLETLPVVHWGITLSTFRMYACQQWSGTPAPRLKGDNP